MNLYIILSLLFLITLLLGYLFKKINIPWIFAALIVGFGLSIFDTFTGFKPFDNDIDSASFTFLAQIGMYLLLFIIGFELDIKDLKKNSKFIFKSTIFITIFAGFFGALILYFIFHLNLFLSIIIGLSFATVGEAILIPILEEFKIVNDPLGQTIIGIGTIDDIFEILALILILPLIGSTEYNLLHLIIILGSFLTLFLLAYFLIIVKKLYTGNRLKFLDINMLFFFVIGVLFLFIGVGLYAEAGAVAALLGGIALKNFIPAEKLEKIESEVKTMCYGFFAPIFFLWVGLSINIIYLILFPLLMILVVLVSCFSKIIATIIIGKKRFGMRDATTLGIGLSVRFSTSIVLVAILYANNLITNDLYSILIASSMILTFAVPIIFSKTLEHRTNGNAINNISKSSNGNINQIA